MIFIFKRVENPPKLHYLMSRRIYKNVTLIIKMLSMYLHSRAPIMLMSKASGTLRFSANVKNALEK